MFGAPRIIPASLCKWQLKPALCLAMFAVITIIALQDYIDWDSLPFLLGLIALPFTITNRQYDPSYIWLAASAVCALLAFLIPVKTILFFSVGFAGFFLVQCFFGKPHFLSGVVLFLMAPVFQYIANTFSFPIRLTLTQWVGKLFQLFTPQTAVNKAVIYHNGNEFSVDPACMGLNMLVASLLLAVMFLGFYQKKYGHGLQWYSVLFYMTLIVGLNIISNAIRIFLLVHFAIMPDAVMHEIVGLLCLVVYVALPATLLATYIVRKLGRPQQEKASAIKIRRIPVRLFLSVLSLIGCACFHIATSDSYNQFRHFAAKQISGYTVTQHKPGIVKVENSRALIYVKYVRSPYDTDHNPTICWKGSGYTFEDVTEQQADGYKMYTARLVNGAETLYTAWCYSNGRHHTTSQLDWRRDMAATKSIYAVINITAATKEALHQETAQVLRNHSLNALFNNP